MACAGGKLLLPCSYLALSNTTDFEKDLVLVCRPFFAAFLLYSGSFERSPASRGACRRDPILAGMISGKLLLLLSLWLTLAPWSAKELVIWPIEMLALFSLERLWIYVK